MVPSVFTKCVPKSIVFWPSYYPIHCLYRRQQEIMATILEEQVQVFEAADAFLKRRLGVIVMDVYEHHDVGMHSAIPIYSRQNICEILDRGQRFGLPGKVYFRPDYLFQPNGKQQLIQDIQKAAMEGGDNIVGAGSKERKTIQMVQYFRCQCAQLYRGNKVDKVTGAIVSKSDYACCHIQNNKTYSGRGLPGKKASKKTTTARRLDSYEDRCPFNLSIFLDQHGYYIKLKSGNPFHEFHGKRECLRVRTKLLDKDSRAILDDLRSARAAPGVAVSLHLQRSRRHGRPTILSHNQIRYIMSKSEGATNPADCLEKTHTGTMDELYNHLESEGLQYISLLQKVDNNKKSLLVNETKIGKATVDLSPIPDDSETVKALEHTNLERHRRPSLNNEQEMVVALAYSTPFEIRQFHAFHVVLHIDSTCHSNRERRQLVLVTSKDNRGKMFTVLRAFLPSEQAWAFQWLFNSVFPQLLGKKALSDVKIMITDGDAQETSQLDYAIKKHFPKVYRQRCSWHIIDRSWKKKLNASLPLGGKKSSKQPDHLLYTPILEEPLTITNQIARTLYRWMFSWSQAGFCNTEDEYVMSKMLFLKYLQSPMIVKEIGHSNVEQILLFLRHSIFPVEEKMVYWKCRHLFHLNIHTNCAHEGVNSGMKHCSLPVKPQHSLAQAAQILTTNAKIKQHILVLKYVLRCITRNFGWDLQLHLISLLLERV